MGVKEVDLIEMFLSLWRRKWLILIPTAIVVAAAGVLSILAPQAWEVVSIIQPGRIPSAIAQGPVQEINLVTRVIALINEKAYHQRLAKELKIDFGQLPAITAMHASHATFFRLVVRDRDVEKARRTAWALFEQIKLEFDSRQEAERVKIDAEIKKIESDREHVKGNLESLESRLARLDQKVQDLERDGHVTLDRIRGLTEEQAKGLRNQDGGPRGTKDPLSYSTAIKDQMAYYDALSKSRDDLKSERESLVQMLRDTRQRAQALATSLAESVEKKRGLVPMRFIAEPMASPGPVTPRKSFVAGAAGFLSIVLFTCLALLMEAVEKRKAGLL